MGLYQNIATEMAFLRVTIIADAGNNSRNHMCIKVVACTVQRFVCACVCEDIVCMFYHIYSIQTLYVIILLFFRAVHVMYVVTIEGIVKKISVLSRTQKTCVLETWKPIPNDVNIPIFTLQYLKETVSLASFIILVVFIPII